MTPEQEIDALRKENAEYRATILEIRRIIKDGESRQTLSAREVRDVLAAIHNGLSGT